MTAGSPPARTGFSFPSTLYPIVDDLGDPRLAHADIAAAVVRGGARLLQLRVKGRSTREFIDIARRVKVVTDTAGASLIVNDRADIAALIGAAGVHLGQDDLPAQAARSLLGERALIGLSTHNLVQAEEAARERVADYIGFGPIFATRSKDNPDPVQGIKGLHTIRSRVRLPIVAIGGITAATMDDVLAGGADAVAMIGEIMRAPDIEAKVRALLANS
jgi:thiamine-phosphate pyrophosphorylase